jgi:transketolase
MPNSPSTAPAQPAEADICINTIRGLAMDAVQKANSGHPGAPMGLAAAGFVLWRRFLVHNPRNPAWANRDRFVLSGGHASMLLYSLLYLTGYELTLEDLMNFRQWGAKTPGHPEYRHTPGVETTTGPLGQGIANAVGMAMAERHLAARFNRPRHAVVDHHTYVMCGDGDLMEGLSAEAASLAGHLGLGRLICLYDNNRISIEGSTDLTFTEDVPRRFAAMGWHVQEVADGNDLDAIATAAIAAGKAEEARPSLISIHTEIAYGSPNKQGSADAHGAPLGVEEVALTKTALGWPADAHFRVPAAAAAVAPRCVDRGRRLESQWQALLAAYTEAHPGAARDLNAALSGGLAPGWDADLPLFAPSDGPLATRSASGQALNALAGRVTALVGGSADLAPSNKTRIESSPSLQAGAYQGRNIHFGVREHAMAAVLNGMALHGGLRPYGGSFLVFADYMRPAIRLAALMRLPVIYVLTHDSIAVGEDGPTHQPIEHLASLRIIPGVDGTAPGRCQRDRRRLAGGASVSRAGGPDPEPPETARAGPDPAGPGRRGGQGGLYPLGKRPQPGCDPDGQRVRGPHHPRGRPAAGRQRHRRPGGEHGQLGAVRRHAGRLPGRGAAAVRGAPPGRRSGCGRGLGALCRPGRRDGLHDRLRRLGPGRRGDGRLRVHRRERGCGRQSASGRLARRRLRAEMRRRDAPQSPTASGCALRPLVPARCSCLTPAPLPARRPRSGCFFSPRTLDIPLCHLNFLTINFITKKTNNKK